MNCRKIIFVEKERMVYIRKALDENYGQFMEWGGMYPTYNLFLTVLYIFLSVLHIFFLIYTAYLRLDDLGPLAEALHFIVFLTTTSFGVFNAVYKRNDLNIILETMGVGFYDYGNTLDEESRKEIAENKKISLRRKKILPRSFIVSVIITGTLIAIRPIVQLLVTGKFKEYKHDGINTLVTVECWYPFDQTILWQNIVCFALQYYVIFVSARRLLDDK